MTNTSGLTDIAREVIVTAQQTGSRIITAESCTAGALATLLADIPSSGDVFLGALVSYAKITKTQLLGVSGDLIADCTAVSGQVASAMAEGALRNCAAANLAIAVTGVCGPQPDEDGNPVGLAFVAVQKRGERAVVERHQFPSQSVGQIRGEIMRQALQLSMSAMHS